MLFGETNQPIYTVSEISGFVKSVVEQSFEAIKIRGEVCDCKINTSGHVYFSIRDNNATINAVIWKFKLPYVGITPENGMELVVSGKITTYEKSSRYQIVVSKAEISGLGEMLRIIKERKNRLTKEGLFDLHHKKPLPLLPKTIGIVTSATGAVLTDILNRIQERCPTHVILSPAVMQGKECVKSIIAALDKLIDINPDVVIIARGGGSTEDLFYFNDEFLVRKIFSMKIPIISAIGHGTDATLIDLVADVCAVTPTAAAEIATPVIEDIKKSITKITERLKSGYCDIIDSNTEKLNVIKRNISSSVGLLTHQDNFYHLNINFNNVFQNAVDNVIILNCSRINNYINNIKTGINLLCAESRYTILSFNISSALQKHCDTVQSNIVLLASKISSSSEGIFTKYSFQLNKLAATLDATSYMATLKRGFTVIKNTEGMILDRQATISTIQQNKQITIAFIDGNIDID